MNALEISIRLASLSFYASIMQDCNKVTIATFGKLEYSLEMKSLCLFPPAAVLPFILPSLFPLINI